MTIVNCRKNNNRDALMRKRKDNKREEKRKEEKRREKHNIKYTNTFLLLNNDIYCIFH